MDSFLPSSAYIVNFKRRLMLLHHCIVCKYLVLAVYIFASVMSTTTLYCNFIYQLECISTDKRKYLVNNVNGEVVLIIVALILSASTALIPFIKDQLKYGQNKNINMADNSEQIDFNKF